MQNPPKIKTLPHYAKSSQNKKFAALCEILQKSKHCRIMRNPPKNQKIAALCEILPKPKHKILALQMSNMDARAQQNSG